MELFKLNKPEPITKQDKILKSITAEKNIFKYIEGTHKPEYLFWDKVRYRPRPKDLTAEEFWALIKFVRKLSPNRVKSIVRDEQDRYFTWQSLPGLEYFLHEVDMQLGGALASSYIQNETTRQWYISRGVMEEAIASSQLEGANTTRKVAKKMLLEQRKPSNQSEQMILNNYLAMKAIEEEFRQNDLTEETFHELHVKLTSGTIDKNDIGRFRTDKDKVIVCDPSKGYIYHIAPPEKFLKSEMERFFEFANDVKQTQQFLHPVIKAIILHFWIGYLHPYTDGNGRLARTIFYWYLLRKGYWAFSYLPISRVIRNSPGQYRDAYLFTEQDDNDLTYFIDYSIRKIARAKQEFESYVKRKEIENRRMAFIAKNKFGLNERQIQLLRYLDKNPGATTLIKVHSTVYNISRMTAKKDLEELESEGLLSSTRSGRERLFSATKGTRQLFK